MSAHKCCLPAVVLVAVLALSVSSPAYSHTGGAGTGPGGVGRTDGAGRLKLWLKGDAGVYTDTGCSAAATNGDPAACWGDQSGSGNSFVQSTAGSRPAYVTGALNGRPVLRFDGAADYLEKSYTASLNNITSTLYLVTRITGGADTHRSPYTSRCGTTNPTRGGYMFVAANTNYWHYWVWWLSMNQWSAAGGGAVDAAWHILYGAYTNVPSVYQVVYVDGQYSNSQTPDTRVNTGCPARIGAGATEGAAAYFYPGDVAEVIYYGAYLNSAERRLVDNYLGAKYGIAILDDYYTGNDPAYVLNVAGIGKESDGYSDEGHSAGMIVGNGGFLQNNGDYILFGHSAATNGNTTSDLPTTGDWAAGNGRRWSRVWFVRDTDYGSNGGVVSIDFDFAEGGMTGSPVGAASNYRLLRRTGTSGQFDEYAQATSISGDHVFFTGVTLGNGYYTLGTVNGNNSPTVIGMQSAGVQAQGPDWAPYLFGALLLGLAGSLALAGRRASSRR